MTKRKEVLYDLLHNKSLYQYLDKEHLDPDNKITQEQWEYFVKDFSDGFFEECSIIGRECFDQYLNQLKEDD